MKKKKERNQQKKRIKTKRTKSNDLRAKAHGQSLTNLCFEFIIIERYL